MFNTDIWVDHLQGWRFKPQKASPILKSFPLLFTLPGTQSDWQPKVYRRYAWHASKSQHALPGEWMTISWWKSEASNPRNLRPKWPAITRTIPSCSHRNHLSSFHNSPEATLLYSWLPTLRLQKPPAFRHRQTEDILQFCWLVHRSLIHPVLDNKSFPPSAPWGVVRAKPSKSSRS